ncbi:hypothetical protein [Streptomyces sp. FIT100]|uniref:hypothetical protein n=1 Tax=Streptomyces sp. FIT100 TaxID=2837956 RepID=UPI0021CA597B|nr:hypothetical protein [Streptomyces sp. FIT100]
METFSWNTWKQARRQRVELRVEFLGGRRAAGVADPNGRDPGREGRRFRALRGVGFGSELPAPAGAAVGRGEDVEFLGDLGHELEAAGVVFHRGLPGVGAAGRPGGHVARRTQVPLDGGRGVELLVIHTAEAIDMTSFQEAIPRTHLRTRSPDNPDMRRDRGGGFSFGHLRE